MNKFSEQIAENQLKELGFKKGDLRELLNHLKDLLNTGFDQKRAWEVFSAALGSDALPNNPIDLCNAAYQYYTTSQFMKTLEHYEPLIDNLLTSNKLS